MGNFIKNMEELKSEFLNGKMVVYASNMSVQLSEKVCNLSGDVSYEFEGIAPPEFIYTDEPCRYEYFVSPDGSELNLYYDDGATDVTEHLTILYEKHLIYSYDKDLACFVRPELYEANADIVLIHICNPCNNWNNDDDLDDVEQIEKEFQELL